MLAVRDIEKRYGKLVALAGVSLEVARGESVLLVGRNGAGKSTLLRIATGFLDPDAGTVSIADIPLATRRALAQQKLGYLPEHAPAPTDLTVADHLRLRARQKGHPASAIAEAMAAADITDVASRLIGTLSKGYRQRVGLADALLGAPPVLVLDEPTSGMDPVQTQAFCTHVAAAARDRAVLISSHAVAELRELATRVVVIDRGAVLADADPAVLCEQTKTETLDAAVLALLGAGGSA